MGPIVSLDQSLPLHQGAMIPAVFELVGSGVVFISEQERQGFEPRAVEPPQLVERPSVGRELQFVRVSKWDDQRIKLLECSISKRLDSFVCQTKLCMPHVDMGELMSEDKLEDIIFLVTDLVEQPLAEIDISAWVGEGVDLGRVEHGVFEGDSLASTSRTIGVSTG